ncbi:MAG: MATE family efflux transporter, partial [Gammaproteobacteria bacterium]|nr:MATE family efflux transporter [Gammaproteobacteria bacterium]
RLSTDSLLLSFLITAAVSMIGVVTINPLFRLLGAPDDMLPLIRGFMIILYAGVPFIVVGMVGMASMRATGDTRLPSKLMILGAILNVVLDPILIFGFGPVPAMGLNGAATAALLARAAILFGTLYVLSVKLDMVSFRRPDPGELGKSWRDILHVGIPAAATNAIVPIVTAIITAMIARYGAAAVAGFGVASRIESLVLVMYYALSAIIGPFVGQNLSAGKEDRILHALRLCTIFCLGSGLLIALLLAVLAGWLPTLFSDSVAVIGVTKLFLWLAPIGYGTYGMVMVMNASFNGLGKPMPGVIVSVMRTVVLYVPIAMLANYWFGIAGIFAAYAIANIISGIAAYAWARRIVGQQFERQAAAYG